MDFSIVLFGSLAVRRSAVLEEQKNQDAAYAELMKERVGSRLADTTLARFRNIRVERTSDGGRTVCGEACGGVSRAGRLLRSRGIQETPIVSERWGESLAVLLGKRMLLSNELLLDGQCSNEPDYSPGVKRLLRAGVFETCRNSGTDLPIGVSWESLLVLGKRSSDGGVPLLIPRKLDRDTMKPVLPPA